MSVHFGLSRRSALLSFATATLPFTTTPGAAHAQARPTENLYLVQGVTFVGTPAQQQAAAPFIYELNRDEAFRKAMTARINSAAASLRIKSGHRIVNDLASVQGDTYALSFAVTGERVDVEKLDGNQFNIQYRLRLQVLVINLSVKPENRRVVVVQSVPVDYLTLSDREPTWAQQLDTFRRLYLDPPAGANALAAWLNEASALDLREGNVWVRVDPFAIQPKAANLMAQAGMTAVEMSQLSRIFTSLAEDGINRGFGIPVIPSVAGDVVETAVVYSFNDSATAQERFGSTGPGGPQATFVYPEPSWIVEFSARDFHYARSKTTTPAGLPMDVIQVALALEMGLKSASPSHPLQPLRTVFIKQERKGIVNDPNRVVPPAADTRRLCERLMKETFEFMVRPASADAWLKGSHRFPDRTAEVKAAMQQFSQQFSTRK